MSLFNFFSKPAPAPKPVPSTVPQERLWVGTIMDMILVQIDHPAWDNTKIADWTIIIDDDRNEPYIVGGRPKPGTVRRSCSLGDCKEFPLVKQCLDMPWVLERLVQDLAFEICQRAEPRWNEIVSRPPAA